MFWGLFPKCWCCGRVQRILVAVTIWWQRQDEIKGLWFTLAKGMVPCCSWWAEGTHCLCVKCAASWVCMWSDLTFPSFLEEHLRNCMEFICWTELFFVKSRLIFINCFRFLNFCMREVFWCMSFPSPSLADIQSGALWFFDALAANHCQQHHLGKKNNKNYCSPVVVCPCSPLWCHLCFPSCSFAVAAMGPQGDPFCENTVFSCMFQLILQLSPELFEQRPCAAFNKRFRAHQLLHHLILGLNVCSR